MNAYVEVYTYGRLLRTVSAYSVARAHRAADDFRSQGFHALVIYGRGTHDV